MSPKTLRAPVSRSKSSRMITSSPNIDTEKQVTPIFKDNPPQRYIPFITALLVLGKHSRDFGEELEGLRFVGSSPAHVAEASKNIYRAP
jgi:hypothetical protein